MQSIEVRSYKHRAIIGLLLNLDGETSAYISPEQARELAAKLVECADNAAGNGSDLFHEVDLP